jgi:hypothetical protein
MDGVPVTLIYTNWRGEIRPRTIIPMQLWFGATMCHPVPQYLIKAIDCRDGKTKDFALAGFSGEVEE